MIIMKPIDKDAIIAEIERLQNDIKATVINGRINKEQAEAYKICVKLRSLVEDTLEVKDVKKETMSDDLEEAIGQSFIYHESHGDDFRSDKQIETAYICGFKTGAKWANEHSIEVKEVDSDKELVEEIYSHIDNIKDTADRMACGNLMHHILDLIGLKHR